MSYAGTNGLAARKNQVINVRFNKRLTGSGICIEDGDQAIRKSCFEQAFYQKFPAVGCLFGWFENDSVTSNNGWYYLNTRQ